MLHPPAGAFTGLAFWRLCHQLLNLICTRDSRSVGLHKAQPPAHEGETLLLIASIAMLGAVVCVGIWLGGLYMLVERPPVGLRWPGLLHGLGGLAGFAALVAGLLGTQPTRHAVKMGAGAFAVVAGALLAGALLAGGCILLSHLRRRPIALALVAAHGMLAITGYTLLVTYLTMLY